MREIKFRAWDKKYMWEWEKIKEWGNIFDQEDLIILQFTGLKDKNGKDIYEGDIVIVDGKRCKTIFRLGGFTFQTEVDKNAYYCIDYHDESKIIGNIYENPGLICDAIHANSETKQNGGKK